MKAWLDENQRGLNKVRVGDKVLGYGKDNAVDLTKEELERAVVSLGERAEIQTTDKKALTEAEKKAEEQRQAEASPGPAEAADGEDGNR